VPVMLEGDGIGRFGQDTKAAVSFCYLEALQNIAKYAYASQAKDEPGHAKGCQRLAASVAPSTPGIYLPPGPPLQPEFAPPQPRHLGP
jgi:hypothetical protein